MNDWPNNADFTDSDQTTFASTKRRFNEDSAHALAAVKKAILEKRDDAYTTQNVGHKLINEMAESVASNIADAFLYGRKVLVVGRSNSDHVLAIVTFIRSMKLLSQAMQRTRDVIETNRGSLGDWCGNFETDYSLMYSNPSQSGDPFTAVEEALGTKSPDIILVLDPVKGLLDYLEALNLKDDIRIVSVLSDSPRHEIRPSDAVLYPDCSSFEEDVNKKALTLTSVVYELCTQCREQAIEKVVKHPRSQALMAQLQSACLESSEGLVALSLLLDDMPMTRLVRHFVKRGVEQINRGAILQPRTAHSKGVLSYGMRSLLAECELPLPVTSQSLQFGLSPLFSALCYAGTAEILIDCLLSNERKTASDKAAKASLIKAKTYFPSLKHLAGLMKGDSEKLDPSLAGDVHRFRYVVHDLDAANEKYIPVFAEQKHAEHGVTQLVVSESAPGYARCFVRSDVINVNDVLRECSFRLAVKEANFCFWADAFSGDILMPTSCFSDFEKIIARCLSESSAVEQSSENVIHDGPLGVNQRTSALALWVEKQPWGRQYPEPLFRQSFVVQKSSTLMESHQEVKVRDVTPEGKVSHGEAFNLLWRNSVDKDQGRLRPDSIIDVEYRLKVRRSKSTSEVYGEIVNLSLVTEDIAQSLPG